MEAKYFIPIRQLCSTYEVEVSFFESLNEVGLIEIITIEETPSLHQDLLSDIEKMIRMYHELNINIEGIDVIYNLLQKVSDLKNELTATQNSLRLYQNL